MKPLTPKRFFLQLAGFALLLLIFLAIAPGIGSRGIDVGVAQGWNSLFADNHDSIAYGVAWTLRFPRAIKALIAGFTLALCGAVFQSLFRNPLATPYTVGIASGASLGALIAYKIHWVSAIWGISTVSLSAFGGALAVLLLILILSRSSAGVSGNTLLLAGITIGFFCSGMMMFITSLASVTETHSTVRWLMGSLDTHGGLEIAALLPLAIPSWLVLFLLARSLNQFALGEDIATTRGVNVLRTELLGIIGGSLGVAAVVSMCGPIGFVGLIIPHIVRLLVGGDHRILLPASALLGASFLIGCDFLTTLVPGWYADLSGTETTAARLPIGVMTAILGTPVFLVLLCTNKN